MTVTLFCIYSWGIEGFNKTPFYGVKLPELQAMWAGHGRILPLVKWGHFFILMSLTVTLPEPSLINFQSNGGKCPRLKL